MSDLEELEAENKRLRRQLKGYKGFAAAHGELGSSSASYEAPASSSPSTSRSHIVRSYEKSCPDCGAQNEHYQKPNAFCADCHAPQGTFRSRDEASEKVGECWNCGSMGRGEFTGDDDEEGDW